MAKTFTQDYLERREARNVTAPKLEMAPKTPKAIDMVMNPVQQLPKVEIKEPSIFQRALDTIGGTLTRTGSQATELGGLALTGLAELNRKKSSTAKAYYQAKESADRYRNLLKEAKTDEDREKWESLAERYTKQAEYFKNKMDEAVEYQSALSGAETAYDAADILKESAELDLENAKQGLGIGGQLAVDFASTAIQWAGDAALGAITGTGALPMMVRAAGGGAQQARIEGADAGQQALYALGSGAVAGATEKIANFASPLKKVFGKGLLDDAIKKATGKMSESAAGRMALSFISEGGEEMLESVAQPLLQNLTYDAGAQYDAEWLGETLYQGLMGGLLGGVLGGAGEIGTAVKTRNAQKTTGAEMAAMGDDMIRAIIDSGLKMDPESKSYKLAKAADKKVKAGKKLSNAELGKLFIETDREYQRQDKMKNTPEPAVQTQEEDAEGIVLPTAEETAAEDGQGIVLPTAGSKAAANTTTAASAESTEQKKRGIVLPTAEETAANAGQGIVLPTAESTEADSAETAVQGDPLEQTAQQYGVDTNTTERVRRISDAIGRKIEFYQDQDTAQHGYYNRGNDTIYINANSRNPVAQIIGHELTHSIEQAGSYAQLQDAVFQEIQRRGTDLEQMRENKRALYARHGVELTDQGAVDSEIVAEFIEKNLLTDEESIRALVRTNRTLAEKIREQIDKLLAKLGNKNAQERDFLNRAKRIYTAALNETTSKAQTKTEEEQVRLTRKQRREQEEKQQQEKRNERIQEKVRATEMDKEELAAAYAAGEITEDEFDRAMDNILSDEGEVGAEMLGQPAKYSFGGENARRADLDALAQAKEMERQGVAMDTISRITGWYTGEDGKWRFEFDDTKATGANVDTEQAAGYDGDRMNDQQGGRENGPETERNDGDILQAQVRGAETVDTGRKKADSTENERTGRKPYDGRADERTIQKWARGFLTEQAKTAASERALESARLYGQEVYLVEDAAIKKRNPNAWALTSGGSVYLSDSIPDGMGEIVGHHEAVHASKQRGNTDYLDLLGETSARLNYSSKQAENVLNLLTDTRIPGKRFSDLTGAEADVVLDELNALVWGFHKADPENARAQFAEMFQDYDSYIAELDAALGTEQSGDTMPEKRQFSISEEPERRQYDSDWRSLTENQQRYFANSVVRDESGRLMTLYHGSTAPAFTEFNTENGVWMTPEESYAQNYADVYDSPYADTAALTGMERDIYMPLQRQRMYEVYADLRNVVDLGEINGVLDQGKLQEIAESSGVDLETLRTMAQPFMGGEVYELTRSREFLDAMRAAGFDGMYAEEDGVPAFCAIGGPEQVKLTSNKNPSGNADIRYSVEEEAAQDQERDPGMLPTAEEYDEIKTTDQQGGADNGQDTTLRGIYGDDVRGETEEIYPRRTGRSGTSDARGGTTDEGRGRAAPASWARGRVIDRPSHAARIAVENAGRYGTDAFVVEDAAIKERNASAWALTSGGSIYISDSIPAELADVVGFHETVHAAKQKENPQYLDMLENSEDYINYQNDRAKQVLDVVLQARFPGMDLADLSQDQINTIFDELNAVVWGYHKADPENARAQFAEMFRDYDAYIAELDAAMERGAEGWRDPGMLPTAEEIDGGADIRYSMDEEAVQDQDQAAEETQEPDIVTTLPQKAQNYTERAERNVVSVIGNALKMPYYTSWGKIGEVARKISQEYLTKGKIGQETMDAMFEQAYESGKKVNEEFFKEYEILKENIRTYPVTISQEDASKIYRYNDFLKSAVGRLRILERGGTPVTKMYDGLNSIYPQLFPEYITEPHKQLVRIFKIAKSIQQSEKNLDEYYGENADEFKRWAKNEFETAVSNVLPYLRDVKRYAEDRAKKSSFEPSNLTQDEVMRLYEDLKKKRKDQEKVQAKNLLTAEDEKYVNELLRGLITPEALDPEKSNVKGIMQVYEAKRQYEEVAKQLRAWNAERRGKLNDQADEILETANDWKDKRAGILYSRETMERNIEDIVPDRELAKKIIGTYFTPVHKANADAIRLKNRMRGKVRNMDLSQKVTGNNTVSEANAVQLLGEAEDNIRVLENSRGRTRVRDGRTLEEWKREVEILWHNNPDLDQQKIRNAVGEFRKIYDELFQQMNDARVRNGYEPINYRQGYFPHFQPGNGDGILDAFGRALGISTEVTALPTTINGLTHTFKPGIRYMGNALERLGFNTAYDAVEGFDRYIEGAADVIYHTDNIQRLRALARQARYRTGDDGIRKQVDDVRADPRWTESEKEKRINDIYENGRFTLSNFVLELDEYTNLLANKKSRYDRSMETQAGRRIYNLTKWLENRVAANMVAVNPASWLTNFIPLTQGGAMVGYRELLTGMWDTLKAYKENDGFVDRSTFLTNRRGSDPLVRAWSENMSAIASQPMTWIDSFVADSLVRARYSQNLKNGLSEQAAMDEADQWVAGVMADRSKGATPTLFQRSNFLAKLFTQFQLEVNNQLSYIVKDMPREYKEKGKKVLAAALLKFALGAFLFDEIYEFFIGRRPALDPIGILNETAGDLTGYELPNLVSLGTGLLTGDVPDFETERANGYETVANLAGNILESTPFVGSLLGGGRLPVTNALPSADAAKVFNGELPWNKRISTAAKELGKPLTYLALPFGGGQLKKVFQGVKAVAQGGQYSIDSSGEKILQYPVYNDSITDAVGNLLTGTIFGVTSTEGGKDWIESGFKSLNAAQTETYLAMQELGVDGRTAFDLITTVRDAGKTGEGTTAELKRKALYDADAPGEAKAAVFYGMLAADSDREVMDQLDDMGADMGSVAYALMKMKDADLLKGAAASSAKRDAIKAAVLTDDEKAEIYRQKISDSRDEDIAAFESAGLSFDDFLDAQNAYTTINEDYEGASRKALEFSRWVNQQDFTADQAAVVKDSFAYYSMVPQSGSYYDKLIGSGLDDEAAYQISSAMEDLEPEEEENSVSKMQRYKAITESGISAEDQMAALSAVMSESEYSKLQAGYAAGVMPESYVRFKEMLPEYDADGNGSFKQEEVEAAIRAIPGLSNAQRAALWQMQNKSWKPSGNPFSTSVGQRVYNDLQSSWGELPTETDASGRIVLPMA